MPRRYVIDVTAYEHVSTFSIDAENEDEALTKACELKNISVTIRSSHEIDQHGNHVARRDDSTTATERTQNHG